jgi:hypothetical protein
MRLLQLTDVYGRQCYVAKSDWERHAPRGHLVPMRYASGRKYHDMPKGLRPQCTMIAPGNVETIKDGPEVDDPGERFNAYLLTPAE